MTLDDYRNLSSESIAAKRVADSHRSDFHFIDDLAAREAVQTLSNCLRNPSHEISHPDFAGLTVKARTG